LKQTMRSLLPGGKAMCQYEASGKPHTLTAPSLFKFISELPTETVTVIVRCVEDQTPDEVAATLAKERAMRAGELAIARTQIDSARTAMLSEQQRLQRWEKYLQDLETKP
jgi:hypothetical protein